MSGTAKRPITAYAHMHRLGNHGHVQIRERLVNGSKSVVGVHKCSVLDTVTAIVPVRAVEALVTDSSDILLVDQRLETQNSPSVLNLVCVTYRITSITDGVVHLVPARIQLDTDMSGHHGAWHGNCKAMLGVMTVGVSGEARLAEIIIFAICTVKKLALREF
jgi:hypothetical protein